jgi:hypothetical protein
MGPVTPPGPTPGGGSGTVKKVSSANASVTVTTPTGPTVGVEVATSPKLGGAAAATFAKLATVPAAATTVTGPDAYGAAAIVGTGTKYARDDHGHGLPAAVAITAETSSTGVALINGTQTILTVTVPNDGKIHSFACSITRVITAPITGGVTVLSWVGAAGETFTTTTTSATEGNHYRQGQQFNLMAGTTVTLKQATAMTAGAAKVFAKIVII